MPFLRKKNKEWATEMVLKLTGDFLAKRGIEREINLESRLSQVDIGLDSIGSMELFAEIERECGIRIPERHWGNPKLTIKQLIGIVQKG